MRKLLLAFSCLVVFANTSEAQINFTNVYSKQNALPRPVADASANDLLAITKTSELYAVGNFTKTFSFGGVDLEPIANSTYVIKYDATGNEQWGVSIQGAATPTSITTDDTGNLYVAGSFADQIIIGSTNGVTSDKVAVTGNKNLRAGFIAKYSPEGVLLSSESFVPTNSPEVTDESASLYFNDLKFNNGKLYTTIIKRCNSMTNNNITLKGSYYDYAGIGYFMYCQTANIVSLNNELKIDELIASFGPEGVLSYPSDVNNATINFDTNGKLYLSTSTKGDLNLTVGTNTQKFINYEFGKTDFEYIIAAINLNDKSFTSKKYMVNNVNESNFTRINRSFIYNDKLILSGIFNEKLAFNNTITAVKRNDVFAAALNLSDLSVAWANGSGIDEGDATKNEEVLTSSIISGNKMILGINTKISGDTNNAITSGTMECDLNTGTLSTIYNGPTGEYLTGMAGYNNLVATARTSDSVNGTLTFFLSKNADAPTGINNTIANNEVKVYPTVATDNINFSEVCDVTVTSISGAIVAKASNVNSLSVASLSAGIYFVTVSNNNGTQTTKIVKR